MNEGCVLDGMVIAHMDPLKRDLKAISDVLMPFHILSRFQSNRTVPCTSVYIYIYIKENG